MEVAPPRVTWMPVDLRGMAGQRKIRKDPLEMPEQPAAGMSRALRQYKKLFCQPKMAYSCSTLLKEPVSASAHPPEAGKTTVM